MKQKMGIKITYYELKKLELQFIAMFYFRYVISFDFIFDSIKIKALQYQLI